MKILLLTVSLALTVLAQDDYSNFDKNFDFNEVLASDRELMAYSKCLLNKGACTPELKQLKEKIPEILATNCAKCTESQKQNGKQLGQKVKTNHPDIWNELVALYDPQGKYEQAWKDFLGE